MSHEDLQKKVDVNYLSAFYAGLLTQRQRQILSLHYEEDLSLGEIADEVGISRQAVHESILRAAARMEELESQLHMAARFRRFQSGLEEVLSALNRHDAELAARLVRDLLALDQEDSDGL